MNEQIKLDLYIDSGEYTNHKEAVFFFREDFVICKKRLFVGDYICGNILIEHKTFPNLVSDVQNQHIFQQCEDMKYNTDFRSYILVSGNISDIEWYPHGISENSLIGTITSITERYNIPVIFLTDINYMCKYMKSLFLKGNDGKTVSYNTVRKPIDTDDMVLNNYCTLPGISTELARRLRTRYPAPHELYNATELDLLQIEGIGKKKSSQIYRFINQQ